ncbi:MAG: heme lyase CcmF/NrfE family subunit [Gammaproteobacteria bacterium]|nr:heme lyase CcmF/NrfE family subunit [Gammaproteobacteria bacterium]
MLMVPTVHWIEFGHFCAVLALLVAWAQGMAPILARLFRRPAWAGLSITGAYLCAILVSLGAASLVHAFVSDNFSVAYVAQNSNSMLPLLYKVSALWGGHEGSLYLWALVLCLYTALLAWRGRTAFPGHRPLVLAVQGWLVFGFLGLILFLSNPFERLLPVPLDGRDLNPLLQDPGMAIHPPMLYLGYVGFSVPFAFALAALISRWPSVEWIGHVRRWALIAWMFLTTGIVLGGWWAYYELGWGGYWAWDPVENASFMPWLTGTALVHSLAVQENRRLLHGWNLFLIITTFALSLLGTFLVRSGVLSSVHAFAVDPGRGGYILAFMAVVLCVSFGLLFLRGGHQSADERILALLSRESLFLGNNVLFVVACLTVFIGTLYPLFLDLTMEEKITVAAPYFNAVVIPLLLLAVTLMAVGPSVPWRKARPDRLLRKFRWPAVAAVIAGLLILALAWPAPLVAPIAVMLVVFGAWLIVSDLWADAGRRAQGKGEFRAVALVRVVLGKRRHYGGMLTHMGVLVAVIGLTAAGLFKQSVSVSLVAGQSFVVGSEELRFDGVRLLKKDNYEAVRGEFVVAGGGVILRPEQRRYPVQTAPTTEAAIDSTLLRDLYLVLSPGEDESWNVRAYVNPLVQWIWIGVALMVAGVLLGLSDRGTRRKTRAAAA